MDNWLLSHEYEFSEGTVRYGISGAAGANVVLVHGTPWSSYTWSLLIPLLAQNYRVHFYDLIGYGQSEMRHAQNVALDVQGKLLPALLDHWGLSKPHVVAHDFGGAIALRAHLLHGCEFASLQLADVVAMAPWGSPFFAHVKEYEAAFAGVPDYIHLAIVRAYIGGALYSRIDQSQFDNLILPWTTASGKAAFYRQISQADQKYTDEIQPLYKQIRCAVSILWGENDSWIPLATGSQLHNAIPHANFTPIPDAGHLVQLENPDFVNSKISEFLRQNSN